MYIRKVQKRNRGSPKIYEYLHLIENVRTENGPRQRLILNLGDINISEDEYKELANCIEGFLVGQEQLVSSDPMIEKIARKAVKRIFAKRSKEESAAFAKGCSNKSERDFRIIDVSSLEAFEIRTIGPEFVCHKMWQELGLDEILLNAGVSRFSLLIMETLVIGRLVDPGSEVHTFEWAENRSAIYELTGKTNYPSLSSFYRAGDLLYKHKETLESNLSKREKDLFSLQEKMYFFDLTNTYFEGEMKGNSKAKRGHSKEKRTDCKLLTLALIIDEDGFAKYSQLFPGNKYEGKTLKEMIECLEKARPDLGKGQTIIMDAGIANEENIGYLKEKKLHYIVVKRGMAEFTIEDTKAMRAIKRNEKGEIEVEVIRQEDATEIFLLCRSKGRKEKDSAIRTKQEKLFVERLEYYRSGLSKKGRTKSYPKILEMIGRLREKYSRSSKVYEIEVIPQESPENAKDIVAKDIIWKKRGTFEKEESFDGCYVLRTDRKELSDEEILKSYIMLTRIEQAFQSLKSSLGFRPIFHQKEDRGDTHLFISVVAYHLLQAIEFKLRNHGDFRCWDTIRDILSTHHRLTNEFVEKTDDGLRKNFVRLCSVPEVEHRTIYKNLNLESIPLQKRNYTKKICSDEKK
jgi:transposase